MTSIGSVQAYEIKCTAKNNPAKKLHLTIEDNDLVSAQTFTRAITHVYAGEKTIHDLGIEEYQLFNEKGLEAIFVLKKKFKPVNTCRYRQGCNNTDDLIDLPDIPVTRVPTTIDTTVNFSNDTGKLIIEGKADEYYSCF